MIMTFVGIEELLVAKWVLYFPFQCFFNSDIINTSSTACTSTDTNAKSTRLSLWYNNMF